MLCASTFGTKPKVKSPQSLWILANKRSEYSDEIGKLNKKEAMMLSRQLKVLDRQERVAESILRKHRREAERLQTVVVDRTHQSINLRQYDRKRQLNKQLAASRERVPQVAMETVRLPPIWGAKDPGTSRRQDKRGSRRREGHRPGVMMSMRALRTGVLDIDSLSEPSGDERPRRRAGGTKDHTDGLASDRTDHSVHTV